MFVVPRPRMLVERVQFALWENVITYVCLVFFDCYPVYDTVCERKKRFLQKILMSSNQLCMIFKDKATADLKNWLLSTYRYIV